MASFARRTMSNTREQLQAAFEQIDKNKNGSIDIGELQELLTTVQIDVNNVTLWKMMEELDTTMPWGQIDFEEFYEWVQTHHSSARETEALGASPNIPAATDWLSRLAELEAHPESTAIRHDVQGSVPLTEAEIIARYTLGKKLGAGKYASVHKCTDTADGVPKAMKIFYKKNRLKKKFYDVIEEANKMRRVHEHPNIVKVYDLLESEERLIMLIEFVEGGQLYDEILKRKPTDVGESYFTERMAGKIIGELTSAIKHMHDRDVLHCDLKPENVLCTHNPEGDKFDIKVADLGLSKILEQGVRQNLTYCGTPLYMAPEMLKKEQYGKPVDLWSIGCMMHELLCGEPPFTGANMMELERNVKSFKGLFSREDTSVTKRIKRQFDKYGVSPKARDLIGHLLEPEIANRMTAGDAMAHDWISKNEELSDTHMNAVQLNLNLQNEKRKFRRTVNKIIMGQKIIRSIKYSRTQVRSAKHNRANHTRADDKANQEEAGCNCVVS